jgi:hypothetical protein
MDPELTKESQQNPWEPRVDPWKMIGTPSQNLWKTMERESIWEPRAMPVKKGSPIRALGSQEQATVEKRKMEEKLLEKPLPRIPGEEQENLRPRFAIPPPSSLWAGDTVGTKCLSYPDEGSP